MTALADHLNAAARAIVGMSERFSSEAADVREAVRHARTEHSHALREISVERGITRDLVEAVHKRLDRMEDSWLAELREIKTALAALAAMKGGRNG